MIMFDVEIKIKRFEETGVYYEICPIGELNDKLSYCDTVSGKTDEEALLTAKTILNSIYNEQF